MTEKDPFVPVSSIEFDKVYRVRDKRILLGISDRDLSFLLGYRATYVRDVEDPDDTLRYTPKDTNYLLSIFDCKLSEIMTDKIPEPFYRIDVEKFTNENGIGYKIYREIESKERILLQYLSPLIKKKQKGLPNNEISIYISNLFIDGFFDEPKTALDVFAQCIKKFGAEVASYLVIDAIGKHTGKRKAPRLLQRKNQAARTVYFKEF
ncbi:hypothetical protein [Pedobacter hartonius]|uniref:Uncharacterized protein n=1 Tax=Pedobacter hartonius TaxID=425514 RepID=A0A1H4G6X6_9SPHI|nr:hypothetical protein [Pedobacter hartonius]SEB05051.1 hypothetical protein SAMN05443550_10963 [Pedobacter hartonius]